MSEKLDFIENIIHEIEALKGEKKYDEALVILERNIIKYQNDYRLFEEMADIYTTQNKIQKWEKAVNFALELNPESATGNYLKGFLLLISEKVEEAIVFLEKSNSFLWNNSEVLRNLWFAYTLVGKIEKGICILKRALHLSPWDILITEDLAMALINNWDTLEWNVLLRQVKQSQGG